MNFNSKTVLITGGCSGIGKIMARKSLERGCRNLVIWDINEAVFDQTQNDLANGEAQIIFFKVDISDLEAVKRAAAQVRAQVGAVDILINNAGVVTGKYFHEHTHVQIDQSMNINTNAAMHITLEFLGPMLAKNSGAICNIASSAGLISNPKMSVYAASKWGMIGWSDSVRLEMKQLNKNISVTTVMPFFINTGMFDGVKSKLLPILEPEKTSERIIRAIEKESSMLAMPLPYWFIRISQGLLPLSIFDWVMDHVFGIYDTMKEFTGRK